jgi:hypothetical protein
MLDEGDMETLYFSDFSLSKIFFQNKSYSALSYVWQASVGFV